jgi:hypothetical protein
MLHFFKRSNREGSGYESSSHSAVNGSGCGPGKLVVDRFPPVHFALKVRRDNLRRILLKKLLTNRSVGAEPAQFFQRIGALGAE